MAVAMSVAIDKGNNMHPFFLPKSSEPMINLEQSQG